MENHNKVTAALKNIVNTNRSTPTYNPGRLYSRKRKHQPKHYTFEVTFFNFPSSTVMDKPTIHEKDLQEIGTATTRLFDDLSVSEVKEEMVNLVLTILERDNSNLSVENINFIYMKKDGRKNNLKDTCVHHHSNMMPLK